MKKKNSLIFGLCTLAIVLAAFFIVNQQPKQQQKQQQSVQEETIITAEAAQAEISFIKISDDENKFLQQILKCEEVLTALESTKDETLDAEVATKLAQKYLSADIRIGSFSVLDKNVYVDYFVGEYRLVFQVEPNGITHKFVGVHDENKNAKALYENIDDKTFKKVVFNTITK